MHSSGLGRVLSSREAHVCSFGGRADGKSVGEATCLLGLSTRKQGGHSSHSLGPKTLSMAQSQKKDHWVSGEFMIQF